MLKCYFVVTVVDTKFEPPDKKMTPTKKVTPDKKMTPPKICWNQLNYYKKLMIFLSTSQYIFMKLNIYLIN